MEALGRQIGLLCGIQEIVEYVCCGSIGESNWDYFVEFKKSLNTCVMVPFVPTATGTIPTGGTILNVVLIG